MCCLIYSLNFPDSCFGSLSLAFTFSLVESCPNYFVLSERDYLNVRIFIRIEIFEQDPSHLAPVSIRIIQYSSCIANGCLSDLEDSLIIV